jgi:hypothetical protein
MRVDGVGVNDQSGVRGTMAAGRVTVAAVLSFVLCCYLCLCAGAEEKDTPQPEVLQWYLQHRMRGKEPTDILKSLEDASSRLLQYKAPREPERAQLVATSPEVEAFPPTCEQRCEPNETAPLPPPPPAEPREIPQHRVVTISHGTKQEYPAQRVGAITPESFIIESNKVETMTPDEDSGLRHGRGGHKGSHRVATPTVLRCGKPTHTHTHTHSLSLFPLLPSHGVIVH